MQTLWSLSDRAATCYMALVRKYVASASPCPIGRVSRVLGDRWVLLILREAFLGIERFEDFMKRLPISRAALVSRLAILGEAGLIKRDSPEGTRATYRLTKAGKALEPTFESMKDWGDEWLGIGNALPDYISNK